MQLEVLFNKVKFFLGGCFCAFALGINIAAILCGEAEAQAPRMKESGVEAVARSRSARVRSKPLTVTDHRQAEQRLADMGYWTGKIDGRWDDASRHALVAFQKVEGLKRTGVLSRDTYDVLLTAGRPSPLEAGPAHVEVDLVRQVLFVVDDKGIVTRILPVSSGSGKDFKSEGWVRQAITWPGRYKIYLKLAGWKKSPLGRLYYPNYFMVGTAIHGYPSVPTRAASHGCIRIPMFASREFSRMTPNGMGVIVHKGTPPRQYYAPANAENPQ